MRHAPIVLDVSPPGKGGLDLAAPDAPNLIFSMKDQTGVAARALRAGANGLLSRNAAPEDFGAATRQLEADEFYLPPKQAVALTTLRAGAIADDLGVSYKTAANTSSSLKKKLGVEGINGLMKFALESGV